MLLYLKNWFQYCWFLFVLSDNIHVVASRTISEMTLCEKIGQMICLDFRNWKNSEGFITPVTEVNGEVNVIIGKYHLGSVVLFSENFVDIEQAKKLISDLQRASIDAGNPPQIVAVDQEGGRVERFNFSREERFKNNADMQSAEEAYQKGEAVAKELKDIGINCDLARLPT